MFGFFNTTTNTWLNNDFQTPHAPDITTYININYQGDADAFRAAHGDPAQWEKREISDAEIAQVLGGYQTTLYVLLAITGGDGEPIPAMYPASDDSALQTLTLTGALLSNPDDPASVIPVNTTWRIAVMRVVRERFDRDGASYAPQVIDSYPLRIAVTQGRTTLTLTRRVEGVYMISDDAFDLVDGSKFGQAGVMFRIVIVGGAQFYKVIGGA